MSRQYISELKPGDSVESQTFLVSSKDLRTTTNGALYIHAILSDKTGQIPARMWQASEVLYKALPEGGFIELKGRAESYKGNLQFIIDAIRPVEAASIDLAEFLPASKHDPEKMWQRVLEILRTIQDAHVQALIKQFVSDESLVMKFKRSPAAASMHHAYVGGLCEHTLNVLENALLIIPRYPEVSLDLVLAAIFLHDIGKTAELNCNSGFSYTDQGQLLGHITIAALWIDQKCKLVEAESGKPFPQDIKHALQHIILSHHGQYEFGSPKLPATPEAVAVHYLDNLDAKLTVFIDAIKNHVDVDSHWTNYNHLLGTKIYRRDVMGVHPKSKD